MQNRLLLLILLLNVVQLTVRAASYQDRFVWVFGWGLRNEKEVNDITNLIATASHSGLNGAVLSASLDTLCKQSPEFFKRLDEVKRACDQAGMELIPSVFSVGYGGGALGHDRQLAEGLPVIDAPFVVSHGQGRFAPDPGAQLKNGGFEEFRGNQFTGFNFHDQPGVISLVDTQVVHSGKASIRLENFEADPHGHGRVMQKVTVHPHRCYRISLWVKTENLKPASGFQISVLANNRSLAPRTFELGATTDWKKLSFLVNSLDYDSFNVYAGVWGGKTGKVWLDDWTLEEVGPINALRRSGTPFTVRSEDGSIAYEEGKDFATYKDPDFNFYRIDRDSAPLQLLPGGRIQEGQRLRVSWYHPMVIHDSQVTVCMAEPSLYEIYEHEAKLLSEHLHPRKILLNMDEIRMGGTCESCRGKDMAALVGECITKQYQILKRYNPDAEIYIWSDMLDPNHNAHGNYYLVKGDFTGSWRHVPKDLIMAIWGGEPRAKSLEFFSSEGFRSLVACYYDAADLSEVKGWLAAARPISNVRGFMYTPWLRRYELLPAFGALLQGDEKPVPAQPSGVVAAGAKLEKLAGDFSFTEGPSADKAGNVFFTDQPNDRIMKWSVDGKLSTFKQPAGRANGMYFDSEGNLLACADEKTELWSIAPDGTVTVLLKEYQGKMLNGPNDVWAHPKGGIYFTDPFYKREWWKYEQMPQDGQHVYYFSRNKELRRVTQDLTQPNGIIGSPDGQFLYVADIGAHKTYRYEIQSDGALSNKTLFCEMGSDGMTMDGKGNIYLTGRGVTVFDPTGKQIDHIDVPEPWTANVSFGGRDRYTLFITASKGFYAIRLNVHGAALSK